MTNNPDNSRPLSEIIKFAEFPLTKSLPVKLNFISEKKYFGGMIKNC